jgi:hypothetical protein
VRQHGGLPGSERAAGRGAVTDRDAARLAWSIAVAALVCAVVGAAILTALLRDPDADFDAAQIVFPLIAGVTFSGVGGLVAARRPGNAVGWLMVAFGGFVGLSLVLDALVQADHVGRISFEGAAWAAWLNAQLWIVSIGVTIPHLLLLFPTGRPPSRRWRFVSVASAGLVGSMMLVALKPGPLNDYDWVENPAGVQGLGGAASAAESVGVACFAVAGIGAAVSLVVRFRRSRGVERLQMKWVTTAVALAVVLWLLGAVAGGLLESSLLENLIGGLTLLAICSIPVAIGVAVLRYRLYDVDRVISKTLVYGSLTVILGGAYATLVLAGQAVFSSFAGGSNLAIAVSTLVVAALFLPLRSRVQRVVDRRFYRRRYDAQRTLEAFGVRMREQVELEMLSSDLRRIVQETIEPSRVSLWLRSER